MKRAISLLTAMAILGGCATTPRNNAIIAQPQYHAQSCEEVAVLYAQLQPQRDLAVRLQQQSVAGSITNSNAGGTLLNVLGPALQNQRGNDLLAQTQQQELQLVRIAQSLGCFNPTASK